MSDRQYIFVIGIDEQVDKLLSTFQLVRDAANDELNEMVRAIEVRKESLQKTMQESYWKPLFKRLQELKKIPDNVTFENVSLGITDQVIYYSQDDEGQAMPSFFRFS